MRTASGSSCEWRGAGVLVDWRIVGGGGNHALVFRACGSRRGSAGPLARTARRLACGPEYCIWLLYSPAVSSDLWFGALTTLAGAALGGASTYLVSRLQIRESRAQRVEAERWDRARRNVDRRFGAYANFLTEARGYRNAILSRDIGTSLRADS